MKLLLIMLGCAVALTAQTAQVVPVDSATAAQLATLAAQVKAAQDAYNKAVLEVERRLLTTRERTSCFAFREGDDRNASQFLTSGTITLYTGNDVRCETPEEKVARAAREAEEKVKQEKWDRLHPERYWLEGFCAGDAEFSPDFRYLVPKPTPAEPIRTPGQWVIPTTGIIAR